jgi:hypothetical protein
MQVETEAKASRYDKLYTRVEHRVPPLIREIQGELAKARTRPVFASEVVMMALTCLKAKLHADARREESRRAKRPQ